MMLQEESEAPTGADALFRQHTIAEIVEIRQKILQEINKKNQDLREMVGERYRELIDAADTIQSMKQLADELPSKLHQLPCRCEQFRPRRLTVENRNPQMFADFAQTKLLLDICGRLGPLIEARQMISSAALIALAQLAIRAHKLPEDLLSSCQKSLRTSTRLLSNGCLTAMADPKCDADSLSEAFCALAILEGHQFGKLVEMFFQQRASHLQKVLDAQITQTKDKFRSVAVYLIHSLNLAQSFAAKPPYFIEYFENHRINSQGIISLVEDPLSLATQFLPKQLALFRCSLPEALSDPHLRDEPTLAAVEAFLEQVRLFCKQKLPMELACHNDCRSISKAYEYLQTSINQTPMHADFLAANTPDIYVMFFREPIVTRVALITENVFNVATEQLLTAVHSSFQDAVRTKSSNVPSLCKTFDVSIKNALDQLNEFVAFKEATSEEYRSLVELTSCSADQMLKRIHVFIVQCIESGVRCCYFLSFLSQLAFALTSCEHLQKIFGGCGWPQRRDLLLKNRNLAASTAMKIVIEEAMKAFREAFSDPVAHLLLRQASIKMAVDVSDVVEESVAVSTMIHLPQHVLLPLNHLLFVVCGRIREVMDCTVSKKVILQANQLLQDEVEKVYQNVLDRRAGLPVSAQQDLALQLMFDIEYLERLLSTRVNEDLINQLTSLIDPVDLLMFRPHLDESVISLVAQTAMIFGLICPQGTFGKPRKQASQEHNIMAMAQQTTQLFSLLPIGASSRIRK